jgi:hypothetical protein
MHGCGLRIGEAFAVSLRWRINRGKTLRVKEQVNPAAQLGMRYARRTIFCGRGIIPSRFSLGSGASQV